MNEQERIAYVYRLACEHLFNDDRLFTERMTIFLLSNSILFLGFVTLLGKDFATLKIALPIAGLILSLLQLPINLYTHYALKYWHMTVRNIEAEGDFKLTGLTPLRSNFDGFVGSLGKREKRKMERLDGQVARTSRALRPGIVWLLLPLLFSALWIVSLAYGLNCF